MHAAHRAKSFLQCIARNLEYDVRNRASPVKSSRRHTIATHTQDTRGTRQPRHETRKPNTSAHKHKQGKEARRAHSSATLKHVHLLKIEKGARSASPGDKPPIGVARSLLAISTTGWLLVSGWVGWDMDVDPLSWCVSPLSGTPQAGSKRASAPGVCRVDCKVDTAARGPSTHTPIGLGRLGLAIGGLRAFRFRFPSRDDEHFHKQGTWLGSQRRARTMQGSVEDATLCSTICCISGRAMGLRGLGWRY
jgi:hypothetical protein